MVSRKLPGDSRISVSSIFSFLSVIFLLALGYWFINHEFEFRYEEVDKGYQGEALTNPFLAAEFYLRSMGQKTKKLKLFPITDSQLVSGDTLMIPGKRIAYDKRRSEFILDWVNRGGHLIITGEVIKGNDYQREDYILNATGLQIEWQVAEDESLEEDEPVNLDVEDEEDFWQVDFVNYQVVSFTSDFDKEVIWQVTNNSKLHAIQIKVGAGRVTLLSDTKMFRNQFIDDYDHAAFLFTLSNDQAQLYEDSVFYYSVYDNQTNLLSWLWQNAYALMVSLFIFLFMVLWKIVPRFGPLVRVQKPVSRRFLDHLVASGNYHWRQGHYSYLIYAVRKQLHVQINKRYPEWLNMSRDNQLKRFAEISQLEVSAVEKALFDTQIERAEDFMIKIKILEKLRKNL